MTAGCLKTILPKSNCGDLGKRHQLSLSLTYFAGCRYVTVSLFSFFISYWLLRNMKYNKIFMRFPVAVAHLDCVVASGWEVTSSCIVPSVFWPSREECGVHEWEGIWGRPWLCPIVRVEGCFQIKGASAWQYIYAVQKSWKKKCPVNCKIKKKKKVKLNYILPIANSSFLTVTDIICKGLL